MTAGEGGAGARTIFSKASAGKDKEARIICLRIKTSAGAGAAMITGISFSRMIPEAGAGAGRTDKDLNSESGTLLPLPGGLPFVGGLDLGQQILHGTRL
jgi:hypothetical protein